MSRPTGGEGIHKLVSKGLLPQGRSQSAGVTPPPNRLETNPLQSVMQSHDASLMELLEMRLGSAAQRATGEGLALMEQGMEKMAAKGVGADEGGHFHRRTTYATQNPMHIHMMKIFCAMAPGRT